MRPLAQIAALILFLPTMAPAFEMPKDEDAARFVTSNVVGTFYHELGHALIDVLQLPVLGREEDAADTLSGLMIHQLWEEDSANAMIADSANAYILYDAENAVAPEEQSYSDEHGLDLQRYYNLICLFYGANPEGRAEIAKTFELPEDRAERCPDEFAQADASWGAMLKKIEGKTYKNGLVMAPDLPKDPIVQILVDEVKSFNESYSLPENVTVTVAPCGEANAFYYPDERSITICTEYAEDLARVWAESE